MKLPKITKEEIEIIKNAKAGNKLAFSRIFHKYKGFVDNLLFQYIKDMDEAKDLTNIVFLKVYDKLSKFTDYTSFGGWLRILTKNTAIDYLRTVKNSNISIDNITSAQSYLSSDDNEMSTINRLTYEFIIDKINLLPPSYRDICILFYKEGLSIDQISIALHMPNGTIKSILHRARNLLKTFLKKTDK